MAVPDHVSMTAVTSSNVCEIGYDPTFRRLYVTVGRDGVPVRGYTYDGVPSQVYLDFLRAPSKGKYLYYTVRANGTDSLYAVRPFDV